MAEFVNDCPRCGASRITFEIKGDVFLEHISENAALFEALCLCRSCNSSSIFELFLYVKNTSNVVQYRPITEFPGALPREIRVGNYVSTASRVTIPPPDHLPADVKACFMEGAACLAINCFNAAGAMFRLALDIATKAILDQYSGPVAPNRDQRNKLAFRLDFLFDQKVLDPSLRDLADSVRHDGNDGAHDGTLTEADAADLVDFTQLLLERIYTEPARITLAKARRDERRSNV